MSKQALKQWHLDLVTPSRYKKKMKLNILRIGTVESEVISGIFKGLGKAFPNTDRRVLESVMPVPEDAFNPWRRQHNSSQVLAMISEYYGNSGVDVILGVTSVDLYASNLNFVFGEAQCPGEIALISLFRLRPEFYGLLPNRNLFCQRAVKEAVHEVGHTFGLSHCQDPLCVMFFSNSIIDTDAKDSAFCRRCSGLLAYMRG